MNSFLKKFVKKTIQKNHKVYQIGDIRIKIKFKTKCVVFIEPGGIGDYVFCQPYFKYIKKSEKYKDCKIFFIAKKEYADFTRAYNPTCFDEIIEYSLEDATSIYPILKKLKKYDVKEVVNLTVAYDNVYDKSIISTLVKEIKAPKNYIEYVDLNNKFPTCKDFKQYELIMMNQHVFEDDVRRIMFEKVLNLPIEKEEETFELHLDKTKKHIAISMMSTTDTRMLSDEKWKIIIDYISENTNENYDILLLGGQKDYEKITEFIENHYKNNKKVINLAGKTSIVLLPFYLEQCEFLVGVETGTIHLAKRVNLKSICLSCGYFYKRYQPYENSCIKYIYPKVFRNYINNATEEELKEIYNTRIPFSPDDIDENEVISEIKAYLQK